jgi:hypothetical protein
MQARAGRLHSAPPFPTAGDLVVRAGRHAAATGWVVAGMVVAAGTAALAHRPGWSWPIDESDAGHRQLAALEPVRAATGSRLSVRFGVVLLIVFAVAWATHLTVLACRPPVPGRADPRRLTVGSALVVAVVLAAAGRLGTPPLGWLARWGLLTDVLALAVAFGIRAGRDRPVRLPPGAGPLALAGALAALAAVPLLQTRLYADREPVTLLARLPAGDARLQGIVDQLSASADVARVELRRSAVEPSWAIVQVDAAAGPDSSDARALVRYLRGAAHSSAGLVTGSAAGHIEADRMRADLPWLTWWFLGAALALPAIDRVGRERRRAPRRAQHAAATRSAVAAVSSDSLMADEPA